MDDYKDVIKATLGEIESILSAKTVLGEPVKLGDATIVPLISVGFGFGVGSGPRKGSKDEKEDYGGGTGAGGGIKPVAVVIADKDGVRVEPVTGARASILEKLGETIPKVIDKVAERSEKKSKDED